MTNGGELWNLDLIQRLIAQYTGERYGREGDYLGRGLRPEDIDIDIYSCRLLEPKTVKLSGMSDTPSDDKHAVYRRQDSGAWIAHCPAG